MSAFETRTGARRGGTARSVLATRPPTKLPTSIVSRPHQGLPLWSSRASTAPIHARHECTLFVDARRAAARFERLLHRGPRFIWWPTEGCGSETPGGRSSHSLGPGWFGESGRTDAATHSQRPLPKDAFSSTFLRTSALQMYKQTRMKPGHQLSLLYARVRVAGFAYQTSSLPGEINRLFSLFFF